MLRAGRKLEDGDDFGSAWVDVGEVVRGTGGGGVSMGGSSQRRKGRGVIKVGRLSPFSGILAPDGPKMKKGKKKRENNEKVFALVIRLLSGGVQD